MRSDRSPAVGLLAAVLLALGAGCGQMGVKLPEPRTLEFSTGTEGCMNDLGDKLGRYAEGTLRTQEWEDVWDCAQGTFATFRKFVKGSSEEGFSREDIHALMSNFLITNQDVDASFVQQLFRFKAAFLGGNEETIRYDEIDGVTRTLDWGKRWTTEFMVWAAPRRAPFTDEDLDRMNERFELAAAELAAMLPADSSIFFSWAEIESFLLNIEEIFGVEVPEWVLPAARFAKRLWLAGSPDGVEASLLKDVVEDGADVLSALLWIRSYSGGARAGSLLTPASLLHAAEIVKPVLDRTISRHGGSIPLSFADEALEWVPESATTAPRGKVVDRTILRKFFRTLNWRVFRAERQEEFNQVALDRIYHLASRYIRSVEVLEQLYWNLGAPPEGVELNALVDAAERYHRSLASSGASQQELDRVDWVVYVARNFKPIFRNDESYAWFEDWNLYSLSAMRKMVLLRIVSEELVPGYSTAPDHDRVSLEDIRTFTGEIMPIMGEYQMTDVTVRDFADRRYREGNLFTPVSDGDTAIDLDEFTHYGALLMSISDQGTWMEDLINELCADGTGNVDAYGYKWMDARCFRREFFARADLFWANSPQLLAWWNGLSTKDKARAAATIEQATRRYGVSELPVGHWDAQSYIGIAHYLEAIFRRFETNRDQIIDLDELMEAFPVFRRELAEFGGIDIDNTTLLEGAFTYVVRFGFAPTLEFWGTSHFAAWLAWKPFWRIRATRMELLKVLAALNPAATPPEDGRYSAALEPDCTSDPDEWELTGRCYRDPSQVSSPSELAIPAEGAGFDFD